MIKYGIIVVVVKLIQKGHRQSNEERICDLAEQLEEDLRNKQEMNVKRPKHRDLKDIPIWTRITGENNPIDYLENLTSYFGCLKMSDYIILII